MLCRPGTFNPFSVVAFLGSDAGSRLLVHVSIAALMVGWPHASTNTTSNRYGSHAANTSPPGCRLKTAVSVPSVSSRMMVFGLQNFTIRPVAMMHVNELMMSVSSGPM
jgi:hypothetical protein